MNQDKATANRALGKLEVTARTIWKLDLPGGIAFRSVSIPGTDQYALEMRDGNRWREVSPANRMDPSAQLLKISSSPTVVKLLTGT